MKVVISSTTAGPSKSSARGTMFSVAKEGTLGTPLEGKKIFDFIL